jgi:hypothetical protein
VTRNCSCAGSRRCSRFGSISASKQNRTNAKICVWSFWSPFHSKMHFSDLKVRQNKRKRNPGDGARTDLPCNLATLQLGPLPSRLQGCSPGTRYDFFVGQKRCAERPQGCNPSPPGRGPSCKVATLVLVTIAPFWPKTVRVKLRLHPFWPKLCAYRPPLQPCNLATWTPPQGCSPGARYDCLFFIAEQCH